MIWVLLALGAHAGNAVVFAVDKALLERKSVISDPVRYAMMSAVLAGLAAVVLLFVPSWPTVFVLAWSGLAGVLRVGALVAFFIALKNGDSSRVVPVAGSIVPLVTLIMAVTILGEALVAQQMLAVGILIAGGVLLSVKLTAGGGWTAKVALATIISGFLFAANFVAMKYVYDFSGPFLAVFAYGRIMEALMAVVILGPIVLRGRGRSPARKRKTKAKSDLQKQLRGVLSVVGLVFVGNKLLAAGAFMLLSYAISLGSVSVVNALQGTQYVFLLAMAWAISRWRPKIFKEEMTRMALWQKFSGTVLVVVGLGLLV